MSLAVLSVLMPAIDPEGRAVFAIGLCLAAMGLVPGTCFKVIRNDSRGPCVIGLKGTRLVLGRGMAERIEVR